MFKDDMIIDNKVKLSYFHYTYMAISILLLLVFYGSLIAAAATNEKGIYMLMYVWSLYVIYSLC